MEFSIFNHLDEIEQSAWATIEPADFPFEDYRFLQALERGRCVGESAGWIPHYLTAWEGKDLLGAMLLYEKNDSYGEYIFDWQWAAMVERSGLPYYPKLISAVPFTPATGPKLLVKPGAENVRKTLIEKSQNLTVGLKTRSQHALFIEERERDLFGEKGFALRETHQFHWQNRAYRDFGDFVDGFERKKRQNILRERASIQDQGLRMERVTGDQLTSEHASQMFQFYRMTIQKNGAIPYLTETFFHEIIKTFGESVLLIFAFDGDECVAGSIFFFKGNTLFGRYWGSTREYKNLHFELCYYQGIEFAIARKLARFEAGAQGAHKINRGFLPALTYSAHQFTDPRIHQTIAKFIDQENAALRRGLEQFKAHSPLKG